MPKVLLCLFSSLRGRNFATDFQHALKPYQISETRAKDLLVLAPATEIDGAGSSAAPAGRRKPKADSNAIATPDASPAGQVLETTPKRALLKTRTKKARKPNGSTTLEMPQMAKKFDVREDITQKMIAAIEAGTPPWRKPWTGAAVGGAFPLRSTGEQYRGINVLLLWLAAEERGYCSAHWITYRQASELGAQVRKGEKASTIVKYGTIERENDQGEDKKIPYTKGYRVFNADQIDGLPEAFYRQPEPPRDLGTLPDPTLDSFFAGTAGIFAPLPLPRMGPPAPQSVPAVEPIAFAA